MINVPMTFYIFYQQILPFINITVMQAEHQYYYDFSYSIAFDNLKEPSESASDSEREFIEWRDIFLKMKPIKDSQLSKVVSLFCRLPLCSSIGIKLLEIWQVKLQIPKTESIQLERRRQKLYEQLQQLSRIFGNEKQRFLPYLCLVYYAIIYKIIDCQILESVEDDFALFDQIYWELKGQLTTKQSMDSMIENKFDKDIYQTYFTYSKEEIKGLYGQDQTYRVNALKLMENRVSLKVHEKRQSNTIRNSLCTENIGDGLNQYENLQLQKIQSKMPLNSSKLSFQKVLKAEHLIANPGKLKHEAQTLKYI